MIKSMVVPQKELLPKVPPSRPPGMKKVKRAIPIPIKTIKKKTISNSSLLKTLETTRKKTNKWRKNKKPDILSELDQKLKEGAKLKIVLTNREKIKRETLKEIKLIFGRYWGKRKIKINQEKNINWEKNIIQNPLGATKGKKN